MDGEMVRKGEELGLWSAEDFSTTEDKRPSGILNILNIPAVSQARNDSIALGGLLLGLVSVVAAKVSPEETFSGRVKKALLFGGSALIVFSVGRVSRGFSCEYEVQSMKAEIYHTERLFEAMEEKKEAEKKKAREDAQHQFFDVGGGVLDTLHPLLGMSITAPPGGPTSTPAFGQDVHARRRTVF